MGYVTVYDSKTIPQPLNKFFVFILISRQEIKIFPRFRPITMENMITIPCLLINIHCISMGWNNTIIIKPQSSTENNNENQGNYRPILVYIRKVFINAVFYYISKQYKKTEANRYRRNNKSC